MNNIAKFVKFAYFDSHAIFDIDTHATIRLKPNIDDHKRKYFRKMGGEH